MLGKILTAAATAFALTTPAVAQQELKAAIVAAMGEAIEDPRYVDVLAKYGLELPDLNDKTLVNSKDYPYPEVSEGTLLDKVIDDKTLRLGWIAVGAPWSVPGPDKTQPVGLSIDYWEIVQEKLSNHYGTDIALDWVEFTEETGNNNMYRWLSTTNDPDCTAVGRNSAGCYDVIGGAYAINARRKGISDITPAYFPLNMSVVRTNVPLPDGVGPLENADQIREAMADPNVNLVLAGLPDTGEDSILTNFKKQMGDTFTHADRTPGSNVLQFAQDSTDAHFVLGTNVRLSSTRFKNPEYCADCAFIPNLLVFGGVGFATALPQ
ncbi:hypothetical protein [Roseibium sp. MMSF_3544]|uniref:hypothetical protein n=1 Tax=unclassified Roseibium TaxID=2629323 RepID=UPI00273D4649|nr:hypothetical protein [Roseibium sp. MMSF_3544]